SAIHGGLAAAAHPCAAIRNPQTGTAIALFLSWFLSSRDQTPPGPNRRTIRPGEPRTDGWGSRQAEHGCFARESGQDAPTERRATPQPAGRGVLPKTGSSLGGFFYLYDQDRSRTPLTESDIQ